MYQIIESWTERHCTDSDSITGNDHYIEHEIYIAPNGDMIHERLTYKWDDYDCKYCFAKCEEIILKKGLK
jgi:hypothetical protein